MTCDAAHLVKANAIFAEHNAQIQAAEAHSFRRSDFKALGKVVMETQAGLTGW